MWEYTLFSLPAQPLDSRPNIRRGDFEQMKKDLSPIDWASTLSGDVKEAWCQFKELVHNLISNHCTIMRRRLTNRPRWLTPFLKKEVNKKRNLWERSPTDRTPESLSSYKLQRNRVKILIAKDRKAFEKNLLDCAMINPKILYSYIRQSTRNKDPVPLLRTAEGVEISDDKDKAEHLSQFFRSVVTSEPAFSSPAYEDEETPTLEAVFFTETIVRNELLNLKESTSPGPDAIPAKLLKEIASEMSKPLALIFQTSFVTGCLPSDWKSATITPLFKGGSRASANNYRPVSLTSICCKIMEKIIKKALVHFLEQYHLLSDAQHGFRSEVNNTLKFKQNSNYAYTKRLYGGVEYITVDGVRISKAADGTHCVAPNDCWEIIHPGQYVILNGFLKGEQAGIVWKTELPTGRCPVGIQYKLAGTPEYPPLPSRAVSVFAKEVLKNERLVHILLFNGKRLDSEWTVKSAEELLTRIKHLEVEADEVMVSFDVISLFTSIPPALAIDTIDGFLREKYDETDQQLKRAHIIELLELCLKTFFTFNRQVYEQKKGTPMGSPLSGLIAEAVLQRLEQQVFSSYPPKFWARYIDDTFVVIKRSEVKAFKALLNSIFPDIQFTMEEEVNNQLPFLDVQVTRLTDGKIRTTVYQVNNTLEFKQNSDYAYTKRLYGNVEYINVDGVRISKAADGTHCVAPNDCWEIIHPGQYVILNGFLKGAHAALVLKPAPLADRCFFGVQYKSAGTPNYQQLPAGAVSVFAKEILKNERLIHILLLNGKLAGIARVGKISVKKKDESIISVFGWYMDVNKVLLFTGHLGTEARQMEIKFTTGRMTRVTINPSNKPEATAPVLTFVDYMHAFKCTKN
nr:unnamed protein product [Spirometra erinaceieuropaei]